MQSFQSPTTGIGLAYTGRGDRPFGIRLADRLFSYLRAGPDRNRKVHPVAVHGLAGHADWNRVLLGGSAQRPGRVPACFTGPAAHLLERLGPGEPLWLQPAHVHQRGPAPGS